MWYVTWYVIMNITMETLLLPQSAALYLLFSRLKALRVSAPPGRRLAVLLPQSPVLHLLFSWLMALLS